MYINFCVFYEIHFTFFFRLLLQYQTNIDRLQNRILPRNILFQSQDVPGEGQIRNIGHLVGGRDIGAGKTICQLWTLSPDDFCNFRPFEYFRYDDDTLVDRGRLGGQGQDVL